MMEQTFQLSRCLGIVLTLLKAIFIPRKGLGNSITNCRNLGINLKNFGGGGFWLGPSHMVIDRPWPRAT